MKKGILIAIVLCIGTGMPMPLHSETPEDIDFHKSVRFHIRNHCSSCHNQAEAKAGVNLDRFDFAYNVARNGQLFLKVIRTLRDESMPPGNKTGMTQANRDTMVAGINRILDKALAVPDPGPGIMRRLSHREYSYTIADLLGVDFNALAFFPSEASGGEGFDNQSRVLYMTPLLWERYYEAADSLIRQVRHDDELWLNLVPETYRPSVFRRLINVFRGDSLTVWNKPEQLARSTITTFGWKAYRRFLEPSEELELMEFFRDVYRQEWKSRQGFDRALEVVFRRMLVSPSFLFRMEANHPTNEPYRVNNFELASRLSYLLWSSMPDLQLLETAYRENLHDSLVLVRETRRMMADPKFKRFAQTFAPQWLGVQDLVLTHQADPVKYPQFTTSLKEALQQEVIEYFNYTFSQGNLLQLLHSDFAMLNQDLAQHYGISGVEGQEMRRVALADASRGGVLGMGAVLASTSMPNRTSPVLRGQWVMENLLGQRIPPPPPDVPDLEDAAGHVDNELDLRALLEFHREPTACKGCHQKMDPIGFGLENFDAIGRWRVNYDGDVPIDATGQLDEEISFEGPAQLKEILLEEQEDFAETICRKLLSYALGRGLQFLDTRTVEHLQNQLITNNFRGEELMLALVNSYPFRHRRSDVVDRYKDNVL